MTKLLADARDQQCTNCGSFHGVVSAHSNLGVHGKGKGLKAMDIFSAHLCFACHAWYDGHGGYGKDPTKVYEYGERQEMWQRAFERTLKRRIEELETVKI